MNLSVILPGLAQSNQRAELLAVLLTCLRDPRSLDIRSDSEYVCKGVLAWRSWVDGGWQHDHADLWNLLAGELRSRVTDVRVSWVLGHARRIDIERGRTTEEDKKGNDGADSLAVSGASLHRVPAEVVEAAKQRKKYARSVHQMMVSILKVRFEAENLQHDAEVADRGSESESMSDNEVCMEFLDDEFDMGGTIQCHGL